MGRYYRMGRCILYRGRHCTMSRYNAIGWIGTVGWVGIYHRVGRYIS